MSIKEITLPSGAVLKITMAPFTVSRALYQSFLDEAKGLKFNPSDIIDVNMYKDLMCTALSSPKIEKAVWACMAKCLYNDIHITDATFEPVDARGDYIEVLISVAKENTMPFMKNLYAQYAPLLEILKLGSQG